VLPSCTTFLLSFAILDLLFTLVVPFPEENAVVFLLKLALHIRTVPGEREKEQTAEEKEEVKVKVKEVKKVTEVEVEVGWRSR
jgi:hypothetical protein